MGFLKTSPLLLLFQCWGSGGGMSFAMLVTFILMLMPDPDPYLLMLEPSPVLEAASP